MTVTPAGQYPISVVNRWMLAALCLSLAVGISALLVNQWLIERGVAG